MSYNIKYLATSGFDFYSDVCTESGTTICSGITNIIWNGTGYLDYSGDWIHSGYGTEQSYARRSGTNGLDASGMSDNYQIVFSNTDGVDASDYDMLIMWIKLLSWSEGRSEVKVDFQTLNGGEWNTSVNLSNYIDIDIINTWQRVVIPLYQFRLSSFIVHKLRLISEYDLSFYLDDVAFGVGIAVAINKSEMTVDETGQMSQQGVITTISLNTDATDLEPSVGTDLVDLRPSITGRSNTPSLRPIPNPTNL